MPGGPGRGADRALGAYLFATFATLEAKDFVGYGWTALDGEEAPLLPEEVWPEEGASTGGVCVRAPGGSA